MMVDWLSSDCGFDDGGREWWISAEGGPAGDNKYRPLSPMGSAASDIGCSVSLQIISCHHSVFPDVVNISNAEREEGDYVVACVVSTGMDENAVRNDAADGSMLAAELRTKLAKSSIS
ncbi:hypothetical protein LguiA_022053 [Lonicera macranthoides]